MYNLVVSATMNGPITLSKEHLGPDIFSFRVCCVDKMCLALMWPLELNNLTYIYFLSYLELH